MPRELIVTGPKQVSYAEYQDRDPVGKEVLVRTLVSGIKHGTEVNTYRGVVPFVDRVFDAELRAFRPLREAEAKQPFFPHQMGSWAAGVVVKVGPDVRDFKPGDRVHGGWKHRETVIMGEENLYPVMSGVVTHTMVFSDPARFALGGIHDAEIKLGDRVAVFGLGAIGMLALQMARLSGAEQVIAVDTLPDRLELAALLGADEVLSPEDCETGLAIKEATGGVGVDVALEISGAHAALQQAIRSVHREGMVVTVSFYGDTAGILDLASEWHHNRISLRSSMPVWGCSHRCQPMWNLGRLERTAIHLLDQGKLQVEPLIGAVIPFDDASEAYAMIDQKPEEAGVKVLLAYS